MRRDRRNFPFYVSLCMFFITWNPTCKAHDGGVVAVELSRVMGGAPQLITIGADKTLAIWDTLSFKVADLCRLFVTSSC